MWITAGVMAEESISIYKAIVRQKYALHFQMYIET